MAFKWLEIPEYKMQLPEWQNPYEGKLGGFMLQLINNPPISLKVSNQKRLSLGNGLKVLGNSVISAGISGVTNLLGNLFSNIFGNDTDAGRIAGTLFSLGVSSIGNTVANNALKGQALTLGLSQNVGSSLAGAGAGLTANYIGQGINSLGGNSMLSRGIGLGVASGLGSLGGETLSNLIAGKGATNTLIDSIKALKGVKGVTGGLSKAAAIGNIAGLAGTVVGTGLQAAFGSSKEYGGRYGSITQNLDTAYDLATAGVGFIPGVGTAISGAMALNKGLSNIFGSTSGMTKTDAILGSAFMPAPVKWLNMWGSSSTGTFNNQSWQNSEKTKAFMLDGFGNLQSRFDLAREEAGKTYGTFSLGAKRAALENIDYANAAWNKVLRMADLNTLQNIKSLDMASINNLRYAQMILGGSDPRTLIGRQGMKILNNATNHNIGMRLLSGAALIDNKQMILCNVPD